MDGPAFEMRWQNNENLTVDISRFVHEAREDDPYVTSRHHPCGMIRPHRAVAISAMDCHCLENSVAIAMPLAAVSHQRRCVVVYHSSLEKTQRRIHHSAAIAMRSATVSNQRRALSCNILVARRIGGGYIFCSFVLILQNGWTRTSSRR